MVNEQGQIVFTNNFAEKMFDYSKNELIGIKLEFLLPVKYKNKHLSKIQKYLDNPSTRQMGNNRELSGIKKDGTEFPVEIGLNPITTPEGNLALAAIVDITHKKKTRRNN